MDKRLTLLDVTSKIDDFPPDSWDKEVGHFLLGAVVPCHDDDELGFVGYWGGAKYGARYQVRVRKLGN